MRNSYAIGDHVAEPSLGDDALDQTRRSHTHRRGRRLARAGRQGRSDNARDEEKTDLLRYAPDGDTDSPTGTQHASHFAQRAHWLRYEHQTKLTIDDVERCVRNIERFSRHGRKHHVRYPGRGRRFADVWLPGREEIGSQYRAVRPGSARRLDRYESGPGRHIENPRAGRRGKTCD